MSFGLGQKGGIRLGGKSGRADFSNRSENVKKQGKEKYG